MYEFDQRGYVDDSRREHEVREVESFKYLGTFVQENGCFGEDVNP